MLPTLVLTSNGMDGDIHMYMHVYVAMFIQMLTGF